MKKILFLVLIVSVIFGLNQSSYAQDISKTEVKEMIDKIDIKLKDDEDYLNINYVQYNPAENPDQSFKSIPRPDGRDPFTFEERDNVQYNIVFLMEGVGLDSLYILYLQRVESTAEAGGNVFGGGSQAAQTITRPLKFSDIYYLKTQRREYYDKFMQIVQAKLRDIKDS